MGPNHKFGTWNIGRELPSGKFIAAANEPQFHKGMMRHCDKANDCPRYAKMTRQLKSQTSNLGVSGGKAALGKVWQKRNRGAATLSGFVFHGMEMHVNFR